MKYFRFDCTNKLVELDFSSLFSIAPICAQAAIIQWISSLKGLGCRALNVQQILNVHFTNENHVVVMDPVKRASENP